VRLLSKVNASAWNGAGFEGRLYQPGARIAAEELGERPVVIEFAGPQGQWKRKPRAHLWILWCYEWEANAWREISRALAFGREWAVTLREPAIRALAPVESPEDADPLVRGRQVSGGLLEAIDAALVMELPAVRREVLSSIYDGVAGRIVAA
jgi:hypothetical protein